ncbi:MAG: endonuclease III [Thermoplasmata archaeon]|nr:MAG: endonuclease III [Thermoplasmata archaeon]
MRMTEANQQKLVDYLKSLYEAEGALESELKEQLKHSGRDPFRVLIGTILSQRTRDENTHEATENLFAKYKNANELAKGDIRTIERLIKPAGFFHVKARKIKEVAGIINNKYHGKVPEDMDELLALPSVGRKTANCVLVYGFGIPAMPVDTHVHRISNRLGLVSTRTPDQTEEALRAKLKKRYWLDINNLMVRFGQDICRPIGPKCNSCKLTTSCSYFKSL